MPTLAQLQEAEAVVNRYRQKLGQRCRVLFVVPDYFEERPKACMNGWGSVFPSIAPDGTAMPCHKARNLSSLAYPKCKTSRWPIFGPAVRLSTPFAARPG